MSDRRSRGQPNRQKRGNRGSGRHQGRGGRGGSKSRGGGLGSRKGGSFAASMGYDGDAVLMAKEDYHDDSSFGCSAPPYRGRREQAKVPMQRLHMTSENQEMVREMLKDIHLGEDFQVGVDDDYEELEWRAEDQYWLTDSRLQVEETQAHSSQKQPRFSSIALNKLHRYGFDKSRCELALHENDGDLGKSLEWLISQCFGLKLPYGKDQPKDPNDYSDDDYCDESTQSEEAEIDIPVEDIMELRKEESTALSSIYGESFEERIPNLVWVISLSLPCLDGLVKEKVDSSKTRQKQEKQDSLRWQDQDICRFYKRGHCKFGSRCRHRHAVPYNQTSEEAVKDQPEDSLYKLELRFPEGNRYPYEVPFVAFSSTNPNLEHHVCLTITTRLMKEVETLAECGLPAVYSLISTVLDDDAEIITAFDAQPCAYSLPESVFTKLPSATVHENQAATSYEESSPTIRSSGFLDTKDANQKKYNDNNQPDMKSKYQEKNSSKISDEGVRSDKVSRQLKDKFKRIQGNEKYRQMQVQRQKLPAWDKQDDILQSLKHRQVLVVSGMTGCGKTTQVPQFILDDHLKVGGPAMCNIVCTQPRRLSAMAVSQRVAQERSEKIGGIVGYQIRMETAMSSQTRLLFCTTGILLRRLEGDPHLNAVTHIIIDEVHERSQDSDFLMLVLRDMLPKRPDLKVILMSATLNAELFSNYFSQCNIIEIPGRTFPVDQYFLEDVIEMTGYMIEDRSPFSRPLKRSNAVYSEQKFNTRECVEDIDGALDSANIHGAAPPRDNIEDQNLSVKQLFSRYSDYSKSTVKCMALMDHEKMNVDLIEALIEWIVVGNHQYPKDGAILVFLPGMAEITTMYEQLLGNPRIGNKHKDRFRLIPLHSTLSSEDQQAVFSRPKPGVIKIVLATNIAETSITIDDVVFVIDAGKMKEKRYDSSKGMESLDTVWVSRANALQRKGRAGRVAAGACFHLFTGFRFHCHLSNQPVPEIQRAPLEQIILRIKILDLFHGMKAEDVLGKIIETPKLMNIEMAISRLQDLGALDTDKELTPLGYHLAFLPVDVRIGKLMLFGAIFRCLDSTLTIAACLSFKSPFVSPFNKKEEATTKKRQFATGNSDHLTMLKAYKSWLEVGGNGSYAAYNYCQENFLSIKTLQMLASMKRQFVELLSDIGFVKSGLTARGVERYARDGDGVCQVTGPEANINSENMKLVAAILVAALYPNVVQVLSPANKYTSTGEGAVPRMPKPEEFKFKTKTEGNVYIHPSSVNFQVRYYESPYLVYHEKVKTSKVYIRDCTMVSVYPLLLFGGGNISIDLDKGQFVLSVDDGWIRFLATSQQVAELVRELRSELDQLLQDKIEAPDMDLCTCPRGSRIITTIVKLISTQ